MCIYIFASVFIVCWERVRIICCMNWIIYSYSSVYIFYNLHFFFFYIMNLTSNVIDPLIKDYIRKNFLLYASALRSSKLVLFDMSWQWFWIKCVSFQAVTARRHVCFVKITQFIHIFPRNWIQFERQSCRIFFICLCLKTIKTAWWGRHRGSCIMDHRSTQSDVCYVRRLLSCFEKHAGVSKRHVFFI